MSQGISNGATTIPAAGSQPVQLGTPLTAISVLIYALSTNTGAVYIGGSTVTSATGVPIGAGVYVNVPLGDIGSLYLAGTENDSVRWVTAGRILPA
jgi:hypothetical protein